jgi:hypothetical protein
MVNRLCGITRSERMISLTLDVYSLTQQAVARFSSNLIPDVRPSVTVMPYLDKNGLLSEMTVLMCHLDHLELFFCGRWTFLILQYLLFRQTYLVN